MPNAAQMVPPLKVSLLGEPRAWRGGVPVKLGGGRRTAAFVALALNANRVVTRTELVAALWDGEPPAGAHSRIYSHVSALRREVGGEEVLHSSHSGYRLVVEPDDLDFAVLQRLREQARGVRARGDHRGELALVDDALAMWQGEALRSVPGPLAESWRQRLTEGELSLRTRRARLLIELGQHDEVVGELTELARRHPAREDIQHSLITALARSGRQAEALTAYRTARETLVERFGTEPGAALRALHQEITANPPAVRRAPPPARPVDSGAARLARARVDGFVGRADQVARIRAAARALLAGRGGSLWVTGAPAGGKTALIAEGLADLAAAGCAIGFGTADEMSHRLPLGALRDCLSGLDHALLHRAGLDAEVSPDDDALRRVDARLRLGGVIARVRQLLEAAAGRPLVLVVDDLHWADDETLLVWRDLHTMTTRYPVLLVSASRPVPRRRNLDLLAALVKENGCDAFELGELSDAEVWDLLLGVRLTGRHTAGAVAAWSGGNPAFARAIGEAVAALPVKCWTTTPEPVAAAVRYYLDAFSPDTRDMLRRASLLGDSHTVGDALRATGKRAHELLNLVDEALAGGVLVDEGGARLRFRHPVVRRVLHESVPAAVRRAALDHPGGEPGVVSAYWPRPA
ncbi:BTAD domain-containing putative transcriptional regulator [Saccharothrix obliqua]|uniref:BTAD domain-containing putative transcriptional regulator n=1 Tax=Saccharothrix obliqua TaxID=2861747 RepID=UPI001C5E9561|nr:BTAD domain-containing putative transcriptional regulator [Saccharothrix obliqua]MBW4721410.1 AAA family ATPase [Saccharothrix obliqua]